MDSNDPDLPTSTRKSIDSFLDAARVTHDIPGASVAVVDRSAQLYSTGYGARDLETGEPVTPAVRFPFASASKLLTAVTVLQLVDEGHLELDAPIRDYVSFWQDVPGDPITVREVLTHSSGMPYDYVGDREFMFAADPPPSPIATLDDLRRHTASLSDQRIPDSSRFMYNDRGYQLLGLLIETVADQSYEAVVEDRVFDRVGMSNSTIGYGSLADQPNTISGYTIEDGVPTQHDFDLDATVVGPPVNGVLASVTDMARFIRGLLHDGELDGVRILSSEQVDAMCSHHVTTRETIDGEQHGQGYGPRVQRFLGEPYCYHTGTAPRIGRAYLGWLPETGYGVALAVNTPDVRIGVLGQGVLAILSDATPETVVPHFRLKSKLQSLSGTYESVRGNVTAVVEAAGSNSYLTIDRDGWTFPAFPESTEIDDYRFYTVWAGGTRGTVEFFETEAGMELRLRGHRLYRTTAPTPSS